MEELQPNQPHTCSAGSHSCCSFIFSIHEKQTLLPFSASKTGQWGLDQYRRQVTHLASGFSPPPFKKAHFPTELISKSPRDLWNQGQEEVKVKASVNSAPAGLVALSNPCGDWLGQGDWEQAPTGFIAQSQRRKKA